MVSTLLTPLSSLCASASVSAFVLSLLSLSAVMSMEGAGVALVSACVLAWSAALWLCFVDIHRALECGRAGVGSRDAEYEDSAGDTASGDDVMG